MATLASCRRAHRGGFLGLRSRPSSVVRGWRRGHFLPVSSIGGCTNATGRGPYSAARVAVEGLSEVPCMGMKPLAVQITVVKPGGFRTDFAGMPTGSPRATRLIPGSSARSPHIAGLRRAGVVRRMERPAWRVRRAACRTQLRGGDRGRTGGIALKQR
ncbi:SDR family NAD(P)-dependent oxidoreductase [Methylobacterium sp. 174MFSha1.1]|uniref:SDR family NAD(P)-dependent oxidoreductase n=1 Tax=Methylobacterium sp. 174MFSha1.1 TaxID=1502749 RepID=UPI001FCDE880|nr:SDR family NAD(P)-dependent oxidoreductase [Methylobacterium sp. 174MFSha1.1]